MDKVILTGRHSDISIRLGHGKARLTLELEEAVLRNLELPEFPFEGEIWCAVAFDPDNNEGHKLN